MPSENRGKFKEEGQQDALMVLYLAVLCHCQGVCAEHNVAWLHTQYIRSKVFWKLLA